MRNISYMVVITAFALATRGALAGDAKKEAIEKERKSFVGLWRVVSIVFDGKKLPDNDVKEISVVNGADGTWTMRRDNLDVMQGTSEIDPTQKNKTIDFTPTDGDEKDKRFLGIYEIKNDTRKMCFAPAGKDRPTEFTSEAGSGNILIRFARGKSE